MKGGHYTETSNALNPDAGKDVFMINPIHSNSNASSSFNPEQHGLETNTEETNVQDTAWF